MADFLDPLTSWPCAPPPGYRGQLAEEFQRSRAELYADVDEADCAWYHTTELPDGRVLDGDWDLRDREADYVGGVEVAGKRVLEVGPASGHLSFWLERHGASVTAFEVGYDAAIHLVPPLDGSDAGPAEAALMAHTRRTTNAWWYLHRAHRSQARMAHGSIYDLPDDLGSYDIVLLGSILLHVRDGFRALQQVAAHATGQLVVVEPVLDRIDGDYPVAKFGSEAERGASVTWWRYSPGALRAMLWRLGFADSTVVHHAQRCRTASGEINDVPYFTVVADRRSGSAEVPDWLTASLDGHAEGGDRAEVADRDSAAAGDGGLEPALAAAISERDAARSELQRLRATRTFRYAAPLRELYATTRRLVERSR